MIQVEGTLASNASMPSRLRGIRLRVVVVAALLVFAACSDGTDPEPNGDPAAPSATSTTSAQEVAADEVVADFYEHWNAGEIDSAMAIAASDVRSSWGTGELLSGRMGFAHAVGHVRRPSDCVVAANGPSSIVTCTVAVTGTLAAEIAVDPPRERHLVTGGRIVNITFSPAYAPAEHALAAAAMQTDPSGFEQACLDRTTDAEVTHSAGCGTFLVGFVTAAEKHLADYLPDSEADPLEVVAGFYETWNTGDVGAAISYLSPDVVSEVGSEPGIGYHRLRNFMDFAVALPLSVSAEDCELLGSATNPAIVSCYVEYGSELFDAMDITGARVPHKVANGMLVSVNVGAQYAAAEKALADFIAAAEPGDFATVCADPDNGAGLTYSEFGFSYNATCGTFAAGFLAEAVEAMTAG